METAMRVLVATDLSEPSAVALREGAALASASGDAFAIVHVVPAPLLGAGSPKALEEMTALPARAHALVQMQQREVQENAPAAGRAEIFVEQGVDDVAIVEKAEAWRADVVVVGSHGRSGLARVLGRVAERVLRHAPCSVLVARRCEDRGWVLVAADAPEEAPHAILAAAAEARRRRAQLEVVQTLGFLELEARYLVELGSPALSPAPPVGDVARRELSESIARLHVRARCRVLDRPAAAAIVSEAEDIGAELVVVGARSSRHLGIPGLSGVAEKVARGAHGPVLVARPRPRLPGDVWSA